MKTASSSTARGGEALHLYGWGASVYTGRRPPGGETIRAREKRGEGMTQTHDTGATAGASAFETIRHTDGEGGEWWSGRELAPVLDYSRWQRFTPVIEKALVSCEASGYAVSDHFTRVGTMIPLGKGAQREVDDWRLSRYACYLIVQNADASKPVIALGQTYFALQTRRMELTDAATAGDTLASLAGLDEAQRRLVAREQLARQNATLASAAQRAGVVSSRDFAVFQDHGYAGLYNGERARDIAARKGLKPGARILDYMGSTELAANLFRATQTDEKLRREGITGRDAANKAHHDVGAAVRSFIIDTLGGTPPEKLDTPSESIAQVQSRERRAVEQEKTQEIRERQPSLFDGLPAPEDGTPDDPRDDPPGRAGAGPGAGPGHGA